MGARDEMEHGAVTRGPGPESLLIQPDIGGRWRQACFGTVFARVRSGELDLMVHIRRTVNDALISIVALTVLLVVLVSVNERVRHEVSVRLNGDRAQTELAGAAANVQQLAGVVVDAARDQTIEHAALAIFVVAAGVLTIFMLRI